jgi:membrane protein required for colicin V production
MNHWVKAFFSLNVTDYVMIAVVLLSTIVSLFRGLVKEMFSLATWIVGFWIAIKFSGRLAAVLGKFIANPTIRYMVIFVTIFILVVILSTLVNKLFSLFIDKIGLDGVDHLLGMIFGFLRGLFLIGVILLLINFTSFVEDNWWKESVLIPHFKVMLKWLEKMAPEGVEALVKVVQK